MKINNAPIQADVGTSDILPYKANEVFSLPTLKKYSLYPSDIVYIQYTDKILKKIAKTLINKPVNLEHNDQVKVGLTKDVKLENGKLKAVLDFSDNLKKDYPYTSFSIKTTDSSFKPIKTSFTIKNRFFEIIDAIGDHIALTKNPRFSISDTRILNKANENIKNYIQIKRRINMTRKERKILNSLNSLTRILKNEESEIVDSEMEDSETVDNDSRSKLSDNLHSLKDQLDNLDDETLEKLNDIIEDLISSSEEAEEETHTYIKVNKDYSLSQYLRIVKGLVTNIITKPIPNVIFYDTMTVVGQPIDTRLFSYGFLKLNEDVSKNKKIRRRTHDSLVNKPQGRPLKMHDYVVDITFDRRDVNLDMELVVKIATKEFYLGIEQDLFLHIQDLPSSKPIDDLSALPDGFKDLVSIAKVKTPLTLPESPDYDALIAFVTRIIKLKNGAAQSMKNVLNYTNLIVSLNVKQYFQAPFFLVALQTGNSTSLEKLLSEYGINVFYTYHLEANQAYLVDPDYFQVASALVPTAFTEINANKSIGRKSHSAKVDNQILYVPLAAAYSDVFTVLPYAIIDIKLNEPAQTNPAPPAFKLK